VPPKADLINNGDSDVSVDSTPSQFLLFRGLEPSLSEELFAKGVAKLYKSYEQPNDQSKKGDAKVVSTTSSAQFGAQDGSIKRVFIVRGRDSNDSCRYGFAEFHSVEVRCWTCPNHHAYPSGHPSGSSQVQLIGQIHDRFQTRAC
jgi:hypothetical protein